MGTGVVVDERGYIVTNHHVVNGVDSLRVTLADGSTYMARVVSFDGKQDLALIKIDATAPLEVMPMGTSSDLMLGETVFAIGNAFGYEHTVTGGIVSALSRDVEVNETQSYENLIQTDASINPGNSGGPLLNLDGDVVGINVAIRAGAQRIGFAIPIDDARRIMARLIAIEQLEGTTHGLDLEDRKQGTARELVVRSVTPGGPGAAAGIRPADVILRSGEVDVIDRVDLERSLLGHSTTEPITLLVRRDGGVTTAKLTLAESQGQNIEPNVTVVGGTRDRSGSATAGNRTWQVLGVRISQVSLAGRDIGTSPYRGGMQVNAVRPGSPAEVNGIRPGDILVGLHQWETVTPQNVSYVLSHPELTTWGPLKFYIIRGRETLFGFMELPPGQ
ncbi:MAG: trypsin-like peptidase domain-containing protein [Planctomycetes bacterium]|nr:trypsin-like peptidase domain-containing protein [Planctomycetota bacterium]